jgi:hypothetical protein
LGKGRFFYRMAAHSNFYKTDRQMEKERRQVDKRKDKNENRQTEKYTFSF